MQPSIDATAAAASDDVLALARVPWVRDHLLRDDAGAELGALCAPTALDAAWAARLHFTSERRGTPPQRNLSVMLVPAAATGSLTVGAAVMHFANGHTAVGRFARDDADGALVFVERRAEHIDVVAITHDGATRLRRTRALFQAGDAFRAALYGDRSAACSALINITLSVSSRACPMCRRRAERPCTCRLAFISPMHAADFTPFRANMHALCGSYNGRSVRLFSKGAPAEDYVTRGTVTPATEPTLVARLAHLAVQSLLVSPSAPIAPVLSPQSFQVPDSTDCGAADDSAKLMSFAESVESIIQQSMHPDAASHRTAVAAASDPLSAFLNEAPTLPNTLPALHTSPVSEITGTPKWSYSWQPQHLSAMPESSDGMDSHSPTTSTVSTLSTPMNHQQQAVVRKPARRPRRTTKKVLTEEMLREREARRQLRIFKNRQAAARSNLRRKLQNDRLKKALAEVRGRALQLRDRHMVLREENLRLKMALLM